MTLLQALHIADFEELPVRHDICEVLAGLQGSDPENCSTVRTGSSRKMCSVWVAFGAPATFELYDCM